MAVCCTFITKPSNYEFLRIYEYRISMRSINKKRAVLQRVFCLKLKWELVPVHIRFEWALNIHANVGSLLRG